MIFIDKGNAIEVASTNKDKVTNKAGDDNNKVDKVDIINITNLKSVKISSQSLFRIAKSINLV